MVPYFECCKSLSYADLDRLFWVHTMNCVAGAYGSSVLFLSFGGAAMLISTVGDTGGYVTTRCAQMFLLCSIRSRTSYCCFLDSHCESGERRFSVVLICLLLLAKRLEHFYMTLIYLLNFCIYYFEHF